MIPTWGAIFGQFFYNLKIKTKTVFSKISGSVRRQLAKPFYSAAAFLVLIGEKINDK